MARSRATVWWVLGVVSVAAGGGYLWWSAEEQARGEAAREREREERRVEREERREQALAALREESGELIPLEGLALGQSRDEVRAVRDQIRPRIREAGEQSPLGLTFMEERLPNRSEVVYGFDREDRLAQIQIMSVLPSAGALRAHLTSMIETYGRPTGVWDCPNTGGVPTRRFTWRRAETALADILLIYGDRISQTLYIAPDAVIGASLQRSACQPVRSEEQLASFPITTVEQIQATQEQEQPPR